VRALRVFQKARERTPRRVVGGITHPFPSLNTCSARRDDGALRGAWLDCTERRGAARSAMRREEVGGVIKRRPRNGVGEVMCCAVCGVAPSAP